jgi:hypothetical protein
MNVEEMGCCTVICFDFFPGRQVLRGVPRVFDKGGNVLVMWTSIDVHDDCHGVVVVVINRQTD